MELLRSLIFVPGNRASMLEKARDFPADVIVADLEDSVPPGEKVAARDMVAQVGASLCGRGQKLMVRVNSLDTGLTRDELEAVIGPHLYGVSLGEGGVHLRYNGKWSGSRVRWRRPTVWSGDSCV